MDRIILVKEAHNGEFWPKFVPFYESSFPSSLLFVWFSFFESSSSIRFQFWIFVHWLLCVMNSTSVCVGLLQRALLLRQSQQQRLLQAEVKEAERHQNVVTTSKAIGRSVTATTWDRAHLLWTQQLVNNMQAASRQRPSRRGVQRADQVSNANAIIQKCRICAEVT